MSDLQQHKQKILEEFEKQWKAEDVQLLKGLHAEVVRFIIKAIDSTAERTKEALIFENYPETGDSWDSGYKAARKVIQDNWTAFKGVEK